MLGNWSFGDYFKERGDYLGVGIGHRALEVSGFASSYVDGVFARGRAIPASFDQEAS